MMSASRLLWVDAGRPAVPQPTVTHDGPCALCGLPIGDMPAVTAKEAFGSGFAGHQLLARPGGTHTCVACAWTMAGRPPDTLRMWSVLYRQDRAAVPSPSEKAPTLGPHIHLASKGGLDEVWRCLIDPPSGPWVCAVTTTGQQHVIPYAAVNSGAGPWQVRLDQTDVTATPAEFATVLCHVARLRAAGFTSDAIRSGSPNVAALTPETMPVWRAHHTPIRTVTAAPLGDLAVTLIHRERTDDILATAAVVAAA